MKSKQIIENILSDLAAGKFGAEGDRFLTTRDLALEYDVSLKTAFRIVSELKEREIIVKDGKFYRIARIIAPQKQGARQMLIGLLVGCLDNPYFAKLASHAEEFANSVGASLIVASSNYDFQTEKERLTMFRRQNVAGIMSCSVALSAEEEAFYSTLKVPYVVLGRKMETLNCDTVMVNDQIAAQSVAEHLIGENIREFVYVGHSSNRFDRRLFGFRVGLMEHGIELPLENIIITDYDSPEKLRKSILKMLRVRRGGRLGIFCYHDLYASRVIGICHELGLKIPEDVSIVGFDNLPIASELYPPLTSVSYPIRDMVRIAFESLYTRIKFHSIGKGVCRYLDSELIVRKSSKI